MEIKYVTLGKESDPNRDLVENGGFVYNDQIISLGCIVGELMNLIGEDCVALPADTFEYLDNPLCLQTVMHLEKRDDGTYIFSRMPVSAEDVPKNQLPTVFLDALIAKHVAGKQDE